MSNPTAFQEDHPVSTSPISSDNNNDDDDDDDNEDQAARQQAARHRYEASVLVRDHLETHAMNNPGASSDYVTWIATLHPENADITIDQRFFSPGNPWWVIYEETKNNQIPTVTAVPVLPDEKNDEEIGLPHNGESSLPSSLPLPLPSSLPSNSTEPSKTIVSFWRTCSPIIILAGISICLPALLTIVLFEMIALLLFYFPSAVFFHTARALSPPNCCTGIVYAIFLLLYYVFSFCDSMYLCISVLVTELIAIVGYIIGFITGGVMWGEYLHQQIRRLCHGMRIIFRKKGAAATQNPPRRFFFLMNSYGTATTATENDDDDDDDDDTNEQYNNDNNGGGNGMDNIDIDNNNDVIIEPVVSVAVNYDHNNGQQQKHDEEKW